jgi:hypothetical protein
MPMERHGPPTTCLQGQIGLDRTCQQGIAQVEVTVMLALVVC